MPDQRPRHATSETEMPDLRPIGDLNILHQIMPDRRPRHATSETEMPEQRPIRDQHACGVSLGILLI